MNIDELLKGSIDMHVHFAPDALMEFRMDALETARYAGQMGIRAIVLKAHSCPTAPLAYTIGKLVPEVKVFGSICLDYEVGGLNAHALLAMAKLGNKVVWMPTHSSSNCNARMSMLPGVTIDSGGFSILDSNNKLVPEVNDILTVIKDFDMVLATGHISPAETFALVEAALAKGISKIVITHPLIVEISEENFTLEELCKLGQMGACIEHTYAGYLPNELRQDPQKLIEAIKAIGAEHCIIGTDLGQNANPPAAEGMRMFIALLLQYGITGHEIELMAKLNPAKLLDLD
ncbi:MAG: DUF6282 family protein [Dehalococcoidia bacterium]